MRLVTRPVRSARGPPTFSTKVAWPAPEALVAVMEALKVPSCVGVPEIRPVFAFTRSPAGNPTAEKLVGVLVARMA